MAVKALWVTSLVLFLSPGDEVLTSEKTFIGFYILARSSGAKLTTCSTYRGL